MSDALLHRGPDSYGYWLDHSSEVALGHRRLAIVDLTPSGAQPMGSVDGRFTLIFNGEIYNHKELRMGLESSGWCSDWRGRSDTETLIAGFSHWGIKATLERAAGMFALALWDSHSRSLILARDRLGEKPLYYSWIDKGDRPVFAFSSEIKSLRRHPQWSAIVDRSALAEFCRFGVIGGCRSIFDGVFQLPPGTVSEVSLARPGIVRSEKFWSLPTNAHVLSRSSFSAEPEVVVDRLDHLLRSIITEQMDVDVPFGAFLSGGIDSSTVVAVMQRVAARPVRTFTIGFGDSHHNEAGYARDVARLIGTEHSELHVTESDLRDTVPKLSELYDQPFGDSSAIPTLLVSRLARSHVTVALSGDGGDEVFGGYNRHLYAAAYWGTVSTLPFRLRHWLASVISMTSPQAYSNIAGRGFLPQNVRTALHKISKVAESVSARDEPDLYLRLRSYLDETVVLGHADGDHGHKLSDSGLMDVFRTLDLSTAEKFMAADALSYLPDDILTKVDRAGMSVSLETRMPLLDHRIVDFAWSLPLNMKIRRDHGQWSTKWALRQVLYRYVPRSMIDRPKMGFSIPLASWLRGSLRDWAESLLSENQLKSDGFFDPAVVRRRWVEHLSGRANHEYAVWNILMFQSWLAAHRY